MAILYITEFEGIGLDSNGHESMVPKVPAVAEQALTYSTAAASAAFNKRTSLVRLQANGICSVSFGLAPTATTSMMRMTAGQTEYFAVPPGIDLKVSAVTNT